MMVATENFRIGRLRSLILMSLAVLALALAGCGRPKDPVHVSGQIAAGHYEVTVEDPGSMTAADIRQRIARLGGDPAKGLYAGPIAAFNQGPADQWVDVPQPLFALVQVALKIGKETGGAVDITDGSIRSVWGLTGRRRPTQVPTTGQLNSAREDSGLGLVELRNDPAALRKSRSRVELALAGLGQSDAVDRMAAALSDMGAEHYLVSLQGSLVARGAKTDGKPWQIGLERPAGNAKQIDRIVGLRDAAMATAGDNQRLVDIDGFRVSPELDPRTGRSLAHSGLSVTVVADSAVRADLLARALLVMGPQVGMRYAEGHKIAAYFFYLDGKGRMRTIHTRSFAPVLNNRE